MIVYDEVEKDGFVRNVPVGIITGYVDKYGNVVKMGRLRSWLKLRRVILKHSLDNSIKKNIFFAFKTLRCVLSGYDSLRGIDYDTLRETGKKEFISIDLGWTEPYDVCAQFNNGQRIPLPIILKGKSRYKLQDMVIKLFWRSRSLREARRDCEDYVRKFEEGVLE